MCSNPQPSPQPVLDHSPSLRASAEAFGLRCLDDSWQGFAHAYRFVCPHGHVFALVAKKLRKGRGACPECRAQARAQYLAEQLARLRQCAAAKGGECLSDRYEGAAHRYRFRCQHGHEWDSLGRPILQGRWCRQCENARKSVAYLRSDVLTTVRAIAAANGGICLSERNLGSGARYRFRCALGHEWASQGTCVMRGQWCAECARVAQTPPDGLARLHQAAAAKGGVCLSETYVNRRRHYRFRCAQGHEWETTADRITAGCWCRECHLDSTRLSIEDARAAAHARGGECLSETYVNTHTKLTWMCGRGHVWQAPLSTIRNHGCWCAECAHADRISDRKSKARARYRVSDRHRPDVEA